MFIYFIIGTALFILICSFIFFILMKHQNRNLDIEWEVALQNLKGLKLLVELGIKQHENADSPKDYEGVLISRFTYNTMLKYDSKIYLQYCIEKLEICIDKYNTNKNVYLKEDIMKSIKDLMDKDVLISTLDSIKIPDNIKLSEVDYLNILMENLDNEPSYFNNKKFDLDFILDYFNKNNYENLINIGE